MTKERPSVFFRHWTVQKMIDLQLVAGLNIWELSWNTKKDQRIESSKRQGKKNLIKLEPLTKTMENEHK